MLTLVDPGRREFEIEVQYAPVEVVLNAVKASVRPLHLIPWMRGTLQPHMANQIVQLFAYNGRGFPGWAPLEESTLRMRRAMGIYSEDPNYATGSMLEYLISHYETNVLGPIAELKIPGNIDDRIMYYKIETAQYGQDNADVWGHDAKIPPRPVLVLDYEDRVEIIKLLQMHIMNFMKNLSFQNLGNLGTGMG